MRESTGISLGAATAAASWCAVTPSTLRASARREIE